MITRTALVAAAALLSTLACGRGTKQSRMDEGVTNNNSPVTLQVTNDNPQDVDVFVAGDGRERLRLGMVTSGQTQTFTVPSTAAHASSLRLQVHPIGGG